MKYSRVKKNGYVRINTNFGPLNLELYCKTAPKACENFITHCKNGYYNNSKFHRLIKHFMLQGNLAFEIGNFNSTSILGGDPSSTGKGGESIWGKPFKDEITGAFKHNARGVLSMANKGSDTNQSQLLVYLLLLSLLHLIFSFITFRPAVHLDGKHTIFGKLVGGLETLTEIERIETNDKDAPLVNLYQ